ncbi:hypothetical protein ACHAXT_001248 [Thalassiosira profunda]
MGRFLLALATILAAAHSCVAFAPIHGVGRPVVVAASRDVSLRASPVDVVLDVAAANGAIADSVAGMAASSSLILSETEAWVQPLSLVLGPTLNFFSFAMLCRIVLSWYPSANLNEFPFSLAVWPTEPLLRLVRGSVPPAFGVDITPVVWLGIFTFVNEILLGQQGLLTMKMKYGI